MHETLMNVNSTYTTVILTPPAAIQPEVTTAHVSQDGH